MTIEEQPVERRPALTEKAITDGRRYNRAQRRAMAARLGGGITTVRRRGPDLDAYRARAFALRLAGKAHKQ